MTAVMTAVIRTERLELRPWRAEDAAVLKDAIDSSLDALRQWVPWATTEPSPVETIAERLASMHAKFVDGVDWTWGLFGGDGSRVLGGIGAHPRIGPGALEIGYWIRTSDTHRGLATEAVRAVLPVAFARPDIERVEIRCDPRNERSAAIPRRLGFTHTAVLPNNYITPSGQPRDTAVYCLMRNDFFQEREAR